MFQKKPRLPLVHSVKPNQYTASFVSAIDVIGPGCVYAWNLEVPNKHEYPPNPPDPPKAPCKQIWVFPFLFLIQNLKKKKKSAWGGLGRPGATPILPPYSTSLFYLPSLPSCSTCLFYLPILPPSRPWNEQGHFFALPSLKPSRKSSTSMPSVTRCSSGWLQAITPSILPPYSTFLFYLPIPTFLFYLSILPPYSTSLAPRPPPVDPPKGPCKKQKNFSFLILNTKSLKRKQISLRRPGVTPILPSYSTSLFYLPILPSYSTCLFYLPILLPSRPWNEQGHFCCITLS